MGATPKRGVRAVEGCGGGREERIEVKEAALSVEVGAAGAGGGGAGRLGGGGETWICTRHAHRDRKRVEPKRSGHPETYHATDPPELGHDDEDPVRINLNENLGVLAVDEPSLLCGRDR